MYVIQTRIAHTCRFDTREEGGEKFEWTTTLESLLDDSCIETTRFEQAVAEHHGIQGVALFDATVAKSALFHATAPISATPCTLTLTGSEISDEKMHFMYLALR